MWGLHNLFMRRGRKHLIEMWIRSGPMLSKLAHKSDSSGIPSIRRVVSLARDLRVNMTPWAIVAQGHLELEWVVLMEVLGP